MFDSLNNISDPVSDEYQCMRTEILNSRNILWSKTIKINMLTEQKEALEKKNEIQSRQLKEVQSQLDKARKQIIELERAREKESTHKTSLKKRVKSKIVKRVSGKQAAKSSGDAVPLKEQKSAIAESSNLNVELEKEETGVSVIIPTYKENDYLAFAVESVLNQSFHNTEVIISCNGKDIEWYHTVKDRYANNSKVHVLYTEIGNAGAGRNIGIEYAGKSHLMFLDDDDYLTSGYIEDLVNNSAEDVEIVCGRLMDSDSEKLSYIDAALKRQSNNRKTRKSSYTISLFSTVTAKLFQTERVKKTYQRFSESMLIAEDVLFWMNNFGFVKGYLSFCDYESKEGYVRRISEDSVSRPIAGKMYPIFESWLNIFKIGTEKIFDETENYYTKVFLGNILFAQNNMMKNYFMHTEEPERGKIEQLIFAEPSFYLNKGLFSGKKGIAFCHNFSPFIDPSAIVAPKRLLEINEMENVPIGWTVVSQDMSNIRSIDTYYNFFFCRFIFEKHIRIGGVASESPKAQLQYGKAAYYEVKDAEADFIYSRSMFAGSHIAAYIYKMKHPETFWYAEFSDPVLYNPQNCERMGVEGSEDDFLQDFWSNIERLVYEKADKIIFTNENQKEYMLNYNRTGIDRSTICEKSLVRMHPVMQKEFSNIMRVNYALPKGKINVAYFGSLPAYRNRDNILNLTLNPDVMLHLFMINTGDLKEFAKKNVVINQNYKYLEFLNIAKRFDYLIVIDSDIDADINPWLPSKVSDYISTDCNVIAIYNKGSALSKIKNDKFVFTQEVDEAFANSLTYRGGLE